MRSGGSRQLPKTPPDHELLGGKSEELGLYDDLPRCLLEGEPSVEYGVVEYRYSRRNPKVYAQLLADYGHTRIAPKAYTASAFIAAAFGRLSDAGLVALQFGPATGDWSYNGIISYWAQPPGPELAHCWSWQHWPTAEGIDPAV